MIRIQVRGGQTVEFDRDTSQVVKSAIESKVRCLRFAPAKGDKAIRAFEEKYRISSSDMVHGKAGR